MPATNLETQNISDTYVGLLHASGDPLPATGQALIRDGRGTRSALKLGANCNGATICGTLKADTLDLTNKITTGLLDITALLNVFYPVGSVIYSSNATNPKNRSGWSDTTWDQVAEGRFIVGVGKGIDSRGDDRSFAAGETYGEYFHVLTEKEMPSHRHGFTGANGNTNNQSRSPFVLVNDDAEEKWVPGSDANYGHKGILDAGGDNPHNNMPPGYGLYVWRRTA